MANRFLETFTAANTAQNQSEVENAAKPPEAVKTAAKPASAPKLPEQSEPETRRRGRPNGKRSNSDLRQVTAYINADTYQRTWMKLVEQKRRQQFSELVDQLLVKWLEE